MDFSQRLMLLLFLGITFSITIFATDQSLFAGGVVGMVGVVLNYVVVLRLFRRSGTVSEQRP